MNHNANPNTVQRAQSRFACLNRLPKALVDTRAHSATYSKLIATVFGHAAVVVDDGDFRQLVTFAHLVIVVIVRGRDLHRA